VAEIGGQGWVFVSKSHDVRSWAANDGYDDSTGFYYSYDSNVGNSRRVATGDIIVIRQDDYVAGWGIVERIEVIPNTPKRIRRCPSCNQTNHYARTTKTPKNKCSNCSAEFGDAEARVTTELVTAYRAYYENTWTEAARPLGFRELEQVIKTRDTFNAIRSLEIEKLIPLLDTISGRDVELATDIPQDQFDLIVGGHAVAVTRRRRGQREFRFRLLERFGESCAFSGAQPPQVLEAAHLYSYAATPEHKTDGGLLLRRDFHSLFDAKLMTINPTNWTLETAPILQRYSSYKTFDGAPLLVPPDLRPDRDLLVQHFEDSRRVFSHN
jgi:hypothetical protein